MPILTLPASFTKGTPASVTLNKNDLFALAPIAADSFFGVQANVKRAIIEYRSSVGGQKKQLAFDLSVASPTASFLASAKARDAFAISRVILEDHDGGAMVLEGAQIPSGLNLSSVVVPKTKVLAHFDGSLADSSGANRTLTLVGTSQLVTDRKKFGTGSLHVNYGRSNVDAGFAGGVTMAMGDLSLGTSDFCLEGYVYAPNGSYGGPMLGISGAANQVGILIWHTGGTPRLEYRNEAGSWISNSAGFTMNAGDAWWHFAIVRSGSSIKLYQNGVAIISASVSGALGVNATQLNIGTWPFWGAGGTVGSFTGNFDEVRLTIGEPVYTGNFTAPTQAF